MFFWAIVCTASRTVTSPQEADGRLGRQDRDAVPRDRLFELAGGGIEIDERLAALLAAVDAFDIVVTTIRTDHDCLPRRRDG